ncbi:MAG: glycosyltransferase family 4 protein [Bacteroidales bacterium]|nr:glycosyltransferase family 4 protein [Bacteroidales bacterium]
MNIILLTMSRITEISSRGIYIDLMRKFRDEGHSVYIVTPHERSLGRPTELEQVDGVNILGVKTLNLQKTSVIEKGIGQVLVESQYKRAIKKYLKGVNIDLILYSTPPITFPKVIKYLKQQNKGAKTYLLLKDIFPQNAVDIGMMSKTGVKGVLYRFFRNKEKNLYRMSDYIGCMSPANVEYVLKHNPEISPERVEVAPNSVELRVEGLESVDSSKIKEKYGLPMDRPIFIYGGNLGKPQGIPFLIQCLDANANRTDCHFVVIGSGTERKKLVAWYESHRPQSVTVMEKLPKEDYDRLASSCDVGLIFLDHRFTIPNYPSRLLPYLENKMPIIAATDPNCDTGKIAEENGYGYWCESNSVEAFTKVVDKMIKSDLKAMGENGYKFLCENYLVQNTYNAIISHV